FFFSSRRRHTRSYGDWSSDVCSSDLRTRSPHHRHHLTRPSLKAHIPQHPATQLIGKPHPIKHHMPSHPLGPHRTRRIHHLHRRKIGRASCRERVQISVAAGSITTKDN